MPTPVEMRILSSLQPLHMALYSRMAAIASVPGVVFLGFDSSHTNPALAPLAMKISMSELEIDRARPSLLYSDRVSEDRGDEIVEEYDGEIFTGHNTTHRFPLPVNLTYQVTTWCHSALDQITMDLAVMQTFPERGALTLEIDGEPALFPIELLSIVPQEDRGENLLERQYRYKVEAWVRSNVPDLDGNIILSSRIDVHQGSRPEDYNLPGNNVPMLSILDEPDEEEGE